MGMKSVQKAIETRIYFIRGEKVMTDSDLAEIYRVETRVLNQAVKRNLKRFPKDFMFRLTAAEFRNTRSQIVMSSDHVRNNSSQFVMSSGKHRGKTYRPYVFTEHGAIMLASILNSKIAVQASIKVVRAFVRLREVLATHKELAMKFELLEGRLGKHDKEIQTLFHAIRELMQPASSPRRQIGYKSADR